MAQLKRSILVSQVDNQLQILPAGDACQQCPSPCRSVIDAPKDAVSANLDLSSSLLNRLALAFFGVPLLLIGFVILCLDTLTATPVVVVLVLVIAAVLACLLGGLLAQRYLTDVISALKHSGVV